jgi:hypothetical protein
MAPLRALVSRFQLSLILALGIGARASLSAEKSTLDVHEWGTFTSVTGADGVQLEWAPLLDGAPLPDFVHRVDRAPAAAGGKTPPPLTKGETRGLVRMETPVIYFYSAGDMEASVRVGFPNGRITEWYPHADVAGEAFDSIHWPHVHVSPGARLPLSQCGNHYYAARETDAAVLGAEAAGRVEFEKFLFYRGVGNFAQPLQARLEAGGVQLQNVKPGVISTALVFERAGDILGYKFEHQIDGPRTVRRPVPPGSLDDMLSELGKALEDAGLFHKEAQAMIETWRSSWFEDGVRVLYVLPREATDRILPLQITPPPRSLERVLVGRVELITPEDEQEVESHLQSMKTQPPIEQEQTRARLAGRFGRFLEPIIEQIARRDPELAGTFRPTGG